MKSKTLQRTGAKRFSFMGHWFYNIIGFGGGPLPASVAELGRWTAFAHIGMKFTISIVGLALVAVATLLVA
jgi:hypothetical protein